MASFLTTAYRLGSSGSRLLSCCQFSKRFYSAQTKTRISMPPNLKIDPRSTCSPLVGMKENDEEDEINQEQNDIIYATPLPQRLHVDIYNFKNATPTGTIWLSDQIFGQDPIRVDLLKRAVVYIRNKLRGRRKAITKTISQVSGSGRKVRPQKGGGTARAGHSRPAHWRGGAKAHGPKGSIQNYANVKLNRKVKRLAILNAFSQKLKEGNLVLVNDFELESHKTKVLQQALENWQVAGRHGTTALLLDHVNDDDTLDNVPVHLVVACRNLYKIKVVNQMRANVYDLLKYEKLFMTLEALTALEARLVEPE